MRILLVVHGRPPASTGGTEIYTDHLAHALAERHEVAIVHPSRPDAGELRSEGITAFAVHDPAAAAAGFEAYRAPGMTAAVAGVLDSWRPDVVHVHHLSGLSTGVVFEARRRGVPVVVTLHDFWTLCPLGQLLDLRRQVCPGPSPTRCLGCVGAQVAAAPTAARTTAARLPLAGVAGRLFARATGRGAPRVAARLLEMRELLRTADARLAPSRFLRERMAALGIGGIEVVPNGHPPLPAAPRVPATNGRVRFGYVGAVIPSKGVHVLAEAFRLLADPRAELQIHGPVLPYHGDEGYGERLRDRLGPDAGALRGAFPHEGRGAVLAGLDVLVVPSIWEENAPLTVHEAFQARVPVVASRHGGLAELVRDGLDGLLFRPGDAHDLARVMRRLMDDGERKRLGNDPPPVPSLPDHVIALEAIYTRVRETVVRRPGRIGAVIVDYRRPEQAAAAARSILDDAGSMPVTVVVVENGPSSTIDQAGVEVVRLAVNGGYAAGVNAGVARLRTAGCDRVLLLNNDARLQPGALRRLAEAVGEDGAAAVAPVVIRAGDGRVESRGARFDLRTGRHRLLGHGERASAGEGLLEAEALAGPALMVRLDAFDRVGPFDEAYFHYFEESEWCARARGAGLRLAVVLGARVVHEGAESLGPASAERLYYASRNHLRAVERLLELEGAPRWLRRAAVVGLNLAHALRQDDVPRAAGLRAVLRGARDFLQGRSGPLRRAS